MATTPHANLTGANLHEPKGVAGTPAKQVYLSNGSNSGSWTYQPTGFGFWRHGGAVQVVNGTRAPLVIDGAGAITTTAYEPAAIRGTSTHLWDTSANLITPISLGDAYACRIVLPFSAKTGTPNTLTLQLDDSGAGTNTILEYYFDLTKKSTPYTATATFTFFAGSPMMANGGEFFVVTDSNSITIDGANIMITRIHDGANY